jgi:hypothetical protein
MTKFKPIKIDLVVERDSVGNHLQTLTVAAKSQIQAALNAANGVERRPYTIAYANDIEALCWRAEEKARDAGARRDEMIGLTATNHPASPANYPSTTVEITRRADGWYLTDVYAHTETYVIEGTLRIRVSDETLAKVTLRLLEKLGREDCTLGCLAAIGNSDLAA